MLLKACAFILLIELLLGARNISAQSIRDDERQSQQGPTSLIRFPQQFIERLANLTDDVWALGANLTQSQLDGLHLSLFKLDTDQFAAGEEGGDEESWSDNERRPSRLDSRALSNQTVSRSSRQGRKMSLFKNVLNKPKVSPLYLVNGTVCRFVNTQPICTTLSTTGLFRGQNPIMSQGQNGGILNGLLQNQQQQQQFQQGQNNQNIQPNQRQVSPNQQGFSNRPGNFQPF